MQTDKPHLVSLGSGRLSTAITLLPLEEGKHGTCPVCHPMHSCPRGCGVGFLLPCASHVCFVSASLTAFFGK